MVLSRPSLVSFRDMGAGSVRVHFKSFINHMVDGFGSSSEQFRVICNGSVQAWFKVWIKSGLNDCELAK